jgi:hypothetical protein
MVLKRVSYVGSREAFVLIMFPRFIVAECLLPTSALTFSAIYGNNVHRTH